MESTTSNQSNLAQNIFHHECFSHSKCEKNFVDNYCYNEMCVSFWTYSFEKFPLAMNYINLSMIVALTILLTIIVSCLIQSCFNKICAKHSYQKVKRTKII
jgi:hypothetical protein